MKTLLYILLILTGALNASARKAPTQAVPAIRPDSIQAISLESATTATTADSVAADSIADADDTVFDEIPAGDNIAGDSIPAGNVAAIDTIPREWPMFPGYRRLIATPQLPDSADVAMYRHKAFWRALAETVGMNLTLNAIDKYILNIGSAHVSFKSIWKNIKNGFEWDADHLGVNMFGHPYNGSFYYNAGRSNGYNYFQSSLFTLLGSTIWEVAMETEYPSTNDMISTPIGGIAMGEVLYRVSDMVIDDRARGGKRFGLELAAFLIDPMRGFTRIVTGKAWRHRSTPGRQYGVPPMSLEATVAGRLLSMVNTGQKYNRIGATLGLTMEYGNRYPEFSKTPFSYFLFRMQLQGMKQQPMISRAEIIGRIISRQVIDRPDLKANLGLYQHYDFFDSDTIRRGLPHKNPFVARAVPYKFATPASFGGGFMMRYAPHKNPSKVVIDAYAHLNAVFLGGILTDYFNFFHRCYNLGPGIGLKLGGTASFHGDRVRIELRDYLYGIFTFGGYDLHKDWSNTLKHRPINVEGDKSNGLFNLLELNLRCRVAKQLYISAGIELYSRATHYRDFTVEYEGVYYPAPTIRSTTIASWLGMTYAF